MAYWLAKAREGQDFDYIQRFDPRFWTVDFPRPMMASVITTAPDALRVDCEFHTRDALAGLIWESEDRFDHPLLSYDTDRNYDNTTLSFRWRSNGVLPLDAVNGPTLTIEGRDPSGSPRIWYVRLWNYASGAPNDAVINLTLADMQEGWLADGAPVQVLDIDRMFISLAPSGYDPASSDLLPDREDGWVEISKIDCDGQRAVLKIGDAVLPPHDLGISTAYDDSYNQTPARMLRNALHLGYRGTLVHYVGMSHFFRLVPDANGKLLADTDTMLCAPCVKWHEAFFAECVALRMQPIVSLSFELFNAHCPDSWKQRDWDGNPALTGWEPPSTLLSPLVDEAITYLQDVTQAFTQMQVAAGLEAQFQVGEPWWWVNPDGRPCIYDAQVRAKYPNAPEIADLTIDYGAPERGFLNWCAERLSIAVRKLGIRARDVGGPGTKTHLLLFTPTLLDPARPAISRMNLDFRLGWDEFNVLQVEDYDWLTAGAEALRRAAYAELDNRFGYPLSAQHYLGGFVLDPADAEEFWARIDAGIDEALARGFDRAFVWALPQITRDGYVRLPFEEREVQAFDDVLYPLNLGRDTGVSPEFSTSISLTASGHERRNSQWSDARLNFDVGPGIRSEAELGVLLEFFRARRGPARGFRLSDPFDFSSNGLTGTPTMTDQHIGIGNGLAATFRLAKSYGGGNDPQRRFITRPRAQTISVSIDGVAANGWVTEDGGKIVFAEAPAEGAEVRAGFLFDVPVRFAEDRLDISSATFAASDAPSVPLIELREEI